MTAGKETRESKAWWLAALAAAAVYVHLALPIVDRQGVNWDEQTDLSIAASYLTSPRELFGGSLTEPNQTRLPMYTFALVTFAGMDPSLANARLVSVALGVSTIALTFWLACLLFDRWKATIAVFVLATSPYFLAYSSLALTEGSAFIMAATVCMTVAAVRFAERPVSFRAGALGVALGVCVSAKLSGIALVAATTVAVLLPSTVRAQRSGGKSVWTEALPWLAWCMLFFCWVMLQLTATGALAMWPGSSLPPAVGRGATRYLAVLAGWSGLLFWSWRARHRPLSPFGRVGLPLIVAGMSFFVFPPVHTTNEAAFASLWREAVGAGEGIDPGVNAGFVAEAAVFHFLVVLLKPGIMVGAALWTGLALAITRLRRRQELRLLVAAIACFVAFLLILPLAQTHYMMAVFPLLVLLGVDAIVDFSRVRPRAGALVAAVAGLLLVQDYRWSYPDLSLNGYQWLGTRYLAGRSTLGYRGVAQIGEDGVEQILRWSTAVIDEHATVVTYLPAGHIVAAVLPEPAFRLINGIRDPDAIRDADYVLTSLNGDIVGGYGEDNPTGSPFKYPLYDRALLETSFEPVFSVRRAFGLEVATVWRRR